MCLGTAESETSAHPDLSGYKHQRQILWLPRHWSCAGWGFALAQSDSELRVLGCYRTTGYYGYCCHPLQFPLPCEWDGLRFAGAAAGSQQKHGVLPSMPEPSKFQTAFNMISTSKQDLHP